MRRGPALAIFVCGASLALAATAAGPLMSQTEQPRYKVEQADGAVELRSYPQMVVASVTVSGSRRAAVQTGFQMLAGYIFGANASGEKIAMTAPVMQRRSTSDGREGNDWTIRFVMPRQWSLESLPHARDERVKLDASPARTFAVIRFSGFWRDGLLKMKTAELRAVMEHKAWKARGAPIYAFYNPPWTLPFLRRNEIMIEVDGR